MTENRNYAHFAQLILWHPMFALFIALVMPLFAAGSASAPTDRQDSSSNSDLSRRVGALERTDQPVLLVGSLRDPTGGGGFVPSGN